ncbi:MAG: ABC-2 transporter permease [Oscillospiraceae bacterium]
MYLPLIAAMCTFMTDSGIIIGDSKCRFGVFSYTLPVSDVQLAAVKYIILIGSALASVVLGILNAAMICGISGKALSAEIMKIILIIAAVCVFVSSISIPLLIRFKVKAAADAFSMGLMGVVVLILWFNMDRLREWFSQFSDESGEIVDSELLMEQVTEKAAEIRDIAAEIAPFVIIISLAAGFAATVMLYKRRVK